jgi:hypothetical protein
MRRLLLCTSPLLAVRPEGATQWRKNPPGELSIDPVADERLVRCGSVSSSEFEEASVRRGVGPSQSRCHRYTGGARSPSPSLYFYMEDVEFTDPKRLATGFGAPVK